MSETLPPTILALIEREEALRNEVLKIITHQEMETSQRLRNEQGRARELTAAIVSLTRDEDKQLLASDEAVAHALKDRYDQELDDLAALKKDPYFARIIIEEFDERGTGSKTVEYKVGRIANSTARIIDWKRSPLAKLYYEYREGDDFSEEIQGRIREGEIKERITTEFKDGELVRMGGSFGEVFKTENGWSMKAPQNARNRPQGRKGLPDVAQLISPEQFKAITENAKSAVLIQGVAGSGKTTVAMYRLAWLVANAHLNESKTRIIVHSPTLRSYIEHSLPALGLSTTKVLTWENFCISLFARSYSQLSVQPQGIPSTIARVKRSLSLLTLIERRAKSEKTDGLTLIQECLHDSRSLIEGDETKLLSKDIIESARLHTLNLHHQNQVDKTDVSLLLRIAILRGDLSEKFEHLVIDEAQDYSPADLSVIVGCVENVSSLTIVGDTAQEVHGSGFPGWDKLLSFLPPEATRYIPLKVSHRSTLPIMKLADAIQGRSLVTEGRNGRVPIWFACSNEELATESLITWVKKAVERYPHDVTAVLCANSREARVVTSLLEPSLGFLVRQGTTSDFSFEAGVLVTEIELVKGLEFCSVLLWNPSAKQYPAAGETGIINRNRLYVAVTRAEENVCIVSYERPSPILPPFSSTLVRGMKIEPEEEEPQEKRHPLELD